MGGHADGSWDPIGEWCVAGGRVYATAINALTLEVYYREARSQGRTGPFRAKARPGPEPGHRGEKSPEED